MSCNLTISKLIFGDYATSPVIYYNNNGNGDRYRVNWMVVNNTEQVMLAVRMITCRLQLKWINSLMYSFIQRRTSFAGYRKTAG